MFQALSTVSKFRGAGRALSHFDLENKGRAKARLALRPCGSQTSLTETCPPNLIFSSAGDIEVRTSPQYCVCLAERARVRVTTRKHEL